MSTAAVGLGLCYPLGILEFPAAPHPGAAANSTSASREEVPGRTLRTISGPDLLDLDIPPPEMLIDGLWQVEGCGYFAGEPKCFKTFSIIDMAIAIVSGGMVFGKFQVQKPGPVLLILEETKQAEAKQRLQLLLRSRGLTARSVPDLFFAIQQGVRLDQEAAWDAIRTRCQEIGPRMVFFDPLARMHAGSESKQEDLAPVLYQLRRLQADFHTAVAVTHHMTKPNADPRVQSRSGHRIRGSGDQYAWLDCALYFTRRRSSERVQVEVEHRESGGCEPFSIALELGDAGDEPAVRLTYFEGETPRPLGSKAREQVLARVSESPGGLNVSQLHVAVGGNRTRVQEAINELDREGAIECRPEKRRDARGRMRPCRVAYLAGTAPQAES